MYATPRIVAQLIIRKVLAAAGRCRHRDVHRVVGVLDDVHGHAIGHVHPVFGKHRLGIAHEALLQGLVLPAGGKEVGELVSLFSHGSLLQGTAFAVISQLAQGVWKIESTFNLPSTGTIDHDKPP